MKYKFILALFKIIKFISSNIIYCFKVVSAIMVILSIFNISLLYCDFNILDEINNLINQIINYFKNLYLKLFNKDEDVEIDEPIDFFQIKSSKKEIKIIEKTVQSPNY